MKVLSIRALAILMFLSACAQPGQGQYGYQDVGKTTVVEYGVIEAVREIGITGKNTGTGATAGAAAGAIAGSAIGQGRGSLLALVAGAVIAGVAGHIAEQAIADRRGLEYVVDLDMGKTITIVQEIHKEDRPLTEGERCMVQTSGSYQRVLPSHKPFPDEDDDDDND